MRKQIAKYLMAFFAALIFVAGTKMNTEAASLIGNPGITLSPDGRAFTTDANDQEVEWYSEADSFETGVNSSVRKLKTGEHYYKSNRDGIVPIGRWEVTHISGQCIHNKYMEAPYYHGLIFGKKSCLKHYYSGWMGYCADCGDLVTPMLIYANKNTIRSIKDLDLELDYYYLCPFCTNLEQGREFGKHYCKDISWNKYKVIYAGNTGLGKMDDSFHMYNNETIYERKKVIPQTHLSQNTYTKKGYEFVGWNTRANGTGIAFSDEQEILNLSKEDCNIEGNGKGEIILYAQWKLSESTLEINPAGGTYNGKASISSFINSYWETYKADPGNLVPPAGYTITYDTQGGKAIPPSVQKRFFQEWKPEGTLKGKFDTMTYIYRYLGKDGTSDRLTALYSYESVLLPTAQKDNSSFGGWYYDAACTKPAGVAGEKITPTSNLTLYAKWVGLVLYSMDNYQANSSKGAVNLNWIQNDGRSKTYFLYQSQDGNQWTKIANASELSNNLSVLKDFEVGSHSYKVPYAGKYKLGVYGAQGGDCGDKIGGYGGYVGGTVWLEEGEILTVIVGGKNGYNGGGAATYANYGNGGGYSAIISNKKGYLLIAGGGGGATALGNGGAGGAVGDVNNGMTGQTGAAGGGGGNNGGSAGVVNIHNHTGNTTDGGGCYGRSVICDGYVESILVKEGDIGGEYCGSCGEGPNAHFPGGPGCDNYEVKYWYFPDTYENKCNRCGLLYDSGNYECTRLLGYERNCIYADRESGCVISAHPAYGGSNYVNLNYMVSYTNSQGQRIGDGHSMLRSQSIGYFQNQNLDNVVAQDNAPPNKINQNSVVIEAVSDTAIQVSWKEPADNGTAYYHKAESYEMPNLNYLLTSNITKNTLTSGIAGYYYRVDRVDKGIVNASNGTFLESSQINVNVVEEQQYIHIAAVDVAGNVSETINEPIGLKSFIPWLIKTDKIGIRDQESVYKTNQTNTYYVRCDGETPIRIDYRAFIDGDASVQYQITHNIFETQMETAAIAQMDVYTARVPMTNNTIITNAANLKKTVNGHSALTDDVYTMTQRTNWCRDLAITQDFTLKLEADGKNIRVTPIAGAEFKEDIRYSDYANDLKNSIFLIGDCTPPIIDGMDILKNIGTIDRDQSSYNLEFTATDNGSGMKKFYVVVKNKDNGTTKTFTSMDKTHISLSISEDDALFTGDFIVEPHAVDNVDNERVESHKISEFTLKVTLEKVLEPREPIFRAGESGLLKITTTGYADRVEVIFPEEMTKLNPELDTVYVYEPATYIEQEELTFMVPLYTPVDNYQISVRAYKDTAKLEDYPKFGIIETEGNVLKDIKKHLK